MTKIQKLSVAALFAVLFALIGVVLTFGGTSSTAHAAESNPAEYWDFSFENTSYNSREKKYEHSDLEVEFKPYGSYTVFGNTHTGIGTFTVSHTPMYAEAAILCIRDSDGVTTQRSVSLAPLPGGSLYSYGGGRAFESLSEMNDGIYELFLAVTYGGQYSGTVLTPIYTVSKSDFMQLPPDPAPPAGYAFAGWYYDEAYTKPYKNEPIIGNVDLYAKFSAITYSATFVGASVSKINFTVESNTIVLPTITMEHHDFLGWYLTPDYSGSPVTTIPAGSVGNLTLYAKLVLIKHVVKFYVNGNVYRELYVEHGTVLLNVLQSADFAQYSLQAFEYPSGIEQPEGEAFTVLGDANVYLEPKTGVDAAVGWAENNWQMLVGGVVLLVLALILLSIIGKKKLPKLEKKSKPRR